MAGAPITAPSAQGQQQGQQQQQKRDAVQANPTTVRQGRPTALNPTGSMPEFFPYSPDSLKPKEYGQMLQRTGRQKWVKAKRK